MGLTYTYLEMDVAIALLETLKMTNVLQEWLAEEITKGIKQGKAEGERESLRLIIGQRFDAAPPRWRGALPWPIRQLWNS